MELFDTNDPVPLHLQDADIIYYPNQFSTELSKIYYEKLLRETPWQQDNITVFGKTYPQPRLTALYADNSNSYSYSNITMHPYLFTSTLKQIKEIVESVTATKYTTCLLNLYRDGSDSNGWHADNERELGKNPVIASVSFGEERWFHLKHRNRKDLRSKILLGNGSILLMKGETQKYWLHQIPKTKRVINSRINLTFRVIK